MIVSQCQNSYSFSKYVIFVEILGFSQHETFKPVSEFGTDVP